MGTACQCIMKKAKSKQPSDNVPENKLALKPKGRDHRKHETHSSSERTGMKKNLKKIIKREVGEFKSVKEREEITKTSKKKEAEAAKKGAKAAPTPKNRSASREQLESIRQALLKKKESLTRYLQSELSELESVDKHHLADLEELASDINDTDSLCEIMDVGNNTLVQIEHALLKIEDGTYGLCEECHGEIPFDRLEALPFATLCVSCKRKQEILRG